METHGNIDESEQKIYVKYRTILEIPREEIQNDLVKIHGDAAIKLMRVGQYFEKHFKCSN